MDRGLDLLRHTGSGAGFSVLGAVQHSLCMVQVVEMIVNVSFFMLTLIFYGSVLRDLQQRRKEIT